MKSSLLTSKFRDTSGASVVIALVFFLICAIIGSVVLTAASVQAKATATHRDTQQAEFSLGSAAQLLSKELDLSIEVLRDSEGNVTDALPVSGTSQSWGRGFWRQYGSRIMAAYDAKSDYVLKGMTVTQSETDAVSGGLVSGDIVVTKDLDIEIDLFFGKVDASTPLSRMRVYLQCIPTFDVAGNLLSFSYEDAVITKGEGGPS